MASVTLRNIDKSFGETRVLRGINLEIADGDFLGLVGPSGCGKSTLLRKIAGLQETTEGEIFIDGHIVNHLPPRSREIAMVFQDYALYPHMTVEENMSFGLRLRRLAKAETSRRVKEAADILQIKPLLKRRPGQLSGGQRQRVAIGRAIVRKPKVFLFDEPLSNLDAKLREEMRVEIAKLHQRLKTTIIYVTHDQVEAMTLAARIAVIDKGVIQQVGSPAELFNRPANTFVGGFIGSPTMNFFEGTLRNDGGLRFEAGAITLPVTKGPAVPGESRTAFLGVRPESVRLAVSPQGGGGVRGRIEIVELLGQRKNVHLAAGSSRLLAVVDASFEGRHDETVSVTFEPRGMHFFDKLSGERI